MAATRPVRVLHLRDSPWVDGPGRTILETASHLAADEVEYHVGAFVTDAAAQHPLVDALRARGANAHKLVDRGGLDSELINAIVNLVDALSIDVLHSSEFRSNVLALIVRRRRPRLKLVTTVHGWIANEWRGRVYRVIDKALLRFFDKVILVSNATRRLVPRWWLRERQLCVLPNALVLGSYGSDIVDMPRRKVDVRGVVTILNVGRLSPEKGQDLLLRAVAAVAADFPLLRLQFAGIGPMEQELRALAKALGIADRVEFLGYINDMPRLYTQIDLVVQSSLTEGMPNAILEAAYLRVPIVATSVGGTAEVVEHGRHAWLIQPGEVQAIETSIRRFLADPEELARMAVAAHANIVTNFSFAARTNRMTRMYRELT